MRFTRGGDFCFFLLVVALLTSGCGTETTNMSGPELELLKKLDASPEARAWLRANGQEAALASNRFDSARDALEFVESLYAAGAVKVVVDSESIMEDEAEMELGDPYADALIVALPIDPGQRARVFALANPECVREGFEEKTDCGQSALYFWWD